MEATGWDERKWIRALATLLSGRKWPARNRCYHSGGRGLESLVSLANPDGERKYRLLQPTGGRGWTNRRERKASGRLPSSRATRQSARTVLRGGGRPVMDVPTAICRGSCLDYWAPPWHLSAHEIAAHIRPSLNATRIPATVVRRRVVRACHARQYRAAEPMRRCSARVKDPGHDRKISEPLRSRPRGVFHFWP